MKHPQKSAVRKTKTEPEVALYDALRRAGVGPLAGDYAGLPGRPDLVDDRHRVAIFVDGAFWHGHPSKFEMGRFGAYWDRKIAGNIARDLRVTRELEESGWLVVRLWDFQIANEPGECVERIRQAIVSRRERDASSS